MSLQFALSNLCGSYVPRLVCWCWMHLPDVPGQRLSPFLLAPGRPPVGALSDGVESLLEIADAHVDVEPLLFHLVLLALLALVARFPRSRSPGRGTFRLSHDR